jgi:DNA topoisomerase VI subunit B
MQNVTNGIDTNKAQRGGRSPCLDGVGRGRLRDAGPQLERATFRTSREMDFFSEKELTAQTGHSRSQWPAVIVKELVDNSLDACEERGIAPEIMIAVDKSGITVSDNGPGIPESVIPSILDFGVRVSSREAYCSPTRGAQGNALKTLVGMPYVLDPEGGRLVITTGGTSHAITCRIDRIAQKPVFDLEETKVCGPPTGANSYKSDQRKTKKVCKSSPGANFYKSAVRVEWSTAIDTDFGRPVWTGIGRWHDQIKAMARGFALFNPHACVTLDLFGDRTTWEATDSSWSKWRPDQPTSPHWYELPHFERLAAAYITDDRQRGIDRTVADFVAEFDGLTGSRKRAQVMEQAAMKRCKLSDLAAERDLRSEDLDRLLRCMKANTKPVHHRRLGRIGKEHVTKRLIQFGCLPESITYKVRKRVDDGVAFIAECAFGQIMDERERRQIYAGANWSPGIKNPFREFGDTGDGLEKILAKQFADSNESIVFALHLAHPRVEYSDRGKSAIVVRE